MQFKGFTFTLDIALPLYVCILRLKSFSIHISDYIKRYATDEALREADIVQTNGIHDSSGEESELSDLSDDENGVNNMGL